MSLSVFGGRKAIPFAAASTFFFTNVASVENPATDLVTFRGSATRRVVFQQAKIVLNVPADATTLEYVFLTHRSGIGTGGVQSTVFTAVNLDESPIAATATAFGWLTSPSPLGTSLGVVDMEPTAAVGGVAPQDPHAARSILTVPSTSEGGAPSGLILDGVNDVLSVGFQLPGRALLTGGASVFAAVYWLEIIP